MVYGGRGDGADDQIWEADTHFYYLIAVDLNGLKAIAAHSLRYRSNGRQVIDHTNGGYYKAQMLIGSGPEPGYHEKA